MGIFAIYPLKFNILPAAKPLWIFSLFLMIFTRLTEKYKRMDIPIHKLIYYVGIVSL